MPRVKPARPTSHRTESKPRAVPRPVRQPPPESTHDLSRAGIVVVLLALLAVWSALFAPQLWGGKVFVLGDSGQYAAYSELSRARWRETGTRTYWNPYVFLGIPASASLADARPQWLPDAWLTAWDRVTASEGGSPLAIPLVAHAIGTVAAAFLARRLWRCGPAAMVVAGSLWALAPGVVVPIAFGHDAQTVTVALLPLSLLAAHGVMTAAGSRNAWGAAWVLAASLAAQVLGGHPQYVAYTAFALVPMVLVLARARDAAARLVPLAAAAAVGALTSAAVWLPTLLYGRHTQRALSSFALREAADWSLLPRDWWSLVWPYAVGFGDATYWGGMRGTDFSHTLGLTGALLALAGVAFAGRSRPAAWGWGALGVVAALLSLGPNLPGLGPAILRLPVLQAFRTPMTWMLLAQLAGALLAARGFERVRERWRGGALLTVAGIALVGAIATLLLAPPLRATWLEAAQAANLDRRDRGVLRNPAVLQRFEEASADGASRAALDLALECSVLAFAFGGLAAARRPGRVGAGGEAFAALALAAGLAATLWPIVRRASGDPAQLRAPAPTALAQLTAADPLHRAQTLDQQWWFSNAWIAWRARHLAGLHGAVPSRWADLGRANLFVYDAFSRACAVRYVGGGGFALADSSNFERRPGNVLARRDALPRAYAVSRVEPRPSDAAVLSALQSLTWNPTEVAYTTGSATGEFAGSRTATIDWARDEPDHIELAVRAEADAFVIVADGYFDGWSATLDDARVPIERVNHILRGVRVPAGEHRVRMRYAREGGAVGDALSRFGVALLMIAGVAYAVAAGRRRSVPV